VFSRQLLFSSSFFTLLLIPFSPKDVVCFPIRLENPQKYKLDTLRKNVAPAGTPNDLWTASRHFQGG
jgi:hypothetical protein